MYIETGNAFWEELEAIARDEGVKLYDVERGVASLRVFIERDKTQSATDSDSSAAEAGSGVTSGDCSRLCRRLNVFLAAEGSNFGIPEDFELEVSSPGVNRNLRLPTHYLGAVGERIKLVLSSEVAGETGVLRGAVFGKLLSANAEGIVLQDEKARSWNVPVGSIKRANVEFPFDTTER